MTTISRRLIRRENGYEVWREISRPDFEVEVIDDAGDPDGAAQFADDLEDASGRLVTLEVAYTPDGDYIGDIEHAKLLCVRKGIIPQTFGNRQVCSIGFCEVEQRWYGWSHRAMFGFEVGSHVKPGDCAYMPKDKETFRLDCLRFWGDEHHAETWAVEERGPNGENGVLTSWRYAGTVPNEKLRSKIDGTFKPYPEKFGRGEWVAQTIDDAKEMAIAFANSVA